MRDHVDEIRGLGAELAIIGNGAASFAETFRKEFELDGPLLVDPELRAYRAAGLRRGRVEMLSPRLPWNALRALAGGQRQTSVQGDPWQLGGVFVLRPGGELMYRDQSREAGDHAPVSAILAVLDEEATPIDETLQTSATQLWIGEALSRVVDPFVMPSFDRTGFRIHSLTFDPEDLDVDLAGKRCLVTGANSGIGFETARALADLGGEVVLLCRDAERGKEALQRIQDETGNSWVFLEVVDMSDLESVAAVADRLGSEPVDALVHNAGVLPDARSESPQGHELTWATHVLGPHLLTRRLRPNLEKSSDARVVWVSSGGMYTRRLNLRDPNWEHRDYDGVLAYAETKRAQVVLSELWADTLRGSSVVVHAMHPGWADTPAVARSLPRFHRVTEQVLRTPAEGADTVVWLAASEPASEVTGRFFFDRRERRTHWLPGTREREEDRTALWELCEAATSEA